MTTNTSTSNNVPDSDKTLSNEQWQIIERDLISEKIPVFRDEEEMMPVLSKDRLTVLSQRATGFRKTAKCVWCSINVNWIK